MPEKLFNNIGNHQGLKAISKSFNLTNIEFHQQIIMESQVVEWDKIKNKDKLIEDKLELWKNKSKYRRDVSSFKIQNQCTVKILCLN